MMSEQTFDQKLRHIEDQFAARREGAAAYRDQEMARLFEECEWTQERIAKRMGKKQAWVSYRLKFGAFLRFITGCDKSSLTQNLTEGRFRDYWGRTKGNEHDRFTHVADILTNGIPNGIAACQDKPGIQAAVLDAMADGKWYTTIQIVATIEDSLVGVTEDQVAAAVYHLRRTPPPGRSVETKKAGRRARYRLVKPKAATPDASHVAALIPLEELRNELAPIIDELRHWGTSSKWAQAPGELLKLAVKLERLIESRQTADTPAHVGRGVR